MNEKVLIVMLFSGNLEGIMNKVVKYMNINFLKNHYTWIKCQKNDLPALCVQRHTECQSIHLAAILKMPSYLLYETTSA